MLIASLLRIVSLLPGSDLVQVVAHPALEAAVPVRAEVHRAERWHVPPRTDRSLPGRSRLLCLNQNLKVHAGILLA